MLEDETIIEDEAIIEDGEEEDFSPFLDALNEQDESEDDESDDDELDEEDDGEDVSPDVLKDRLKRRNRTIAKRSSALKRMQKEIEGLKKGSQVTPELLAQLINNKDTTDEDEGGLDIASLKEQVEDDPASVIDIVLSLLTNTENKVANVLERRDTALLKKAKVVIDPVVQKTMEALASQDDFAGFTEDQLESVARKMLRVSGNRRPPAGTSGVGRKTRKAKAPTQSDLESKYSSQLDEMGLGAEV